jgi:hypothetical protein
MQSSKSFIAIKAYRRGLVSVGFGFKQSIGVAFRIKL